MSWPRVLVCAACVGLVVGLHWLRLIDPQLPRAGSMYAGDLNQYYFPAFVFVRDALLSGQLPLWNPYQMAGVPFIGLHVTMPLYPLLLIFLPLPPALAIAAHGLLHIALCGLFTWLLARRLGLNEIGAGVATLVYGLSFQLALNLFSSANLSSMAWLPAMLWALHGLASKPNIPRALALAAVLAMSFLSGFAQGFLYTLQAASLYVLFLLAGPFTVGRRGAFLGALALGGMVAFGLVAIQLFPALDLAARSARSIRGVSFENAAAYGLSTATMLRSLLGVSEGWTQLPKLLLPLAALALMVRRHRLHAVFFALLLLLLWDFMRGSQGWIFQLYYQLPGGNLFRIPARAAFVYVLAAAMLMGIGASLATTLLAHRRSSAVAIGIALMLAIAADQYSRSEVGIRYDPLAAPEGMMGPEEVEYFAKFEAGYDRIFVERWVNDAFPMKMGSMHGMFIVPDYEPILPASYAEFLATDELWHGQLGVTRPEQRSGGIRTPPAGLRYFSSPESMDLFSVRYYLDARSYGALPARDPHEDLPALIEGVPVMRRPVPIYRRDRALPRAYVVHQTIVASGHEALELLDGAGAFDPRSQVVLDTAASPQPLLASAREFARIEEYWLNRVELSVRCESDCLVVLTDLFDPGWSASVDSLPAPILRANYLFRAVLLKAGDHRVTFRYHPTPFYFGAAITSSTLLMIAVYALSTRRRGIADANASD